MKCNLFIGMSFVLAISLNSCGMRDYMADADSCKELVKEFKTEDVLIGRSSTIHTTDSLVFVLDHTSTDSIIHMFDAFTDMMRLPGLGSSHLITIKERRMCSIMDSNVLWHSISTVWCLILNIVRM